jgi:hypothetical protein
MKIRQGFVSNSSSSSFCILGVGLDKDSFKIGDKTLLELQDEFEEKENSDDDESTDDYFDDGELIEQFFKDNGLDHQIGYEGDDTIYVGLFAQSLNDDMTLKQSKEFIEDKLKFLGIKHKEKIGWMEGSTGNG